MFSVQKVLIIGGGIGGMSLGIALRRAGIEAEIVELQSEYNVYGVGIIQSSAALRALDAIGVADETMRRGSPYGLVKMCAPHGVQFAETGPPPIGRFPSHNGISRRILHDVLYEEAVKLGVVFRMGLTIDTLENGENQVHVVFADGSEGDYELVVGADGVNSKVRTMVLGEMKPHYVGSSVWRYPFKRPEGLETAYMYFGRKAKIGLVPMTDDTIYMFVVTAEGDNPRIPDEELAPRLRAYLDDFPAPFVQTVKTELTDPSKIVYRPLETLFLNEKWYHNRVVLIGDAAHATIPQLGSGAMLAIEDAVVLAELLQSGESISEVLEKYQNRRYERCKLVVDVSGTIAEWERMEWRGEPLPEGANIGALMGKTLGQLCAPF